MKKVLIRIGIGFAFLLGLLWFGGRWILSFSKAQYSGTIQLSGIQAPVEVLFDAKGIPQIWATNNPDLLFTLGWVHASERLFQMEAIRRFTSGELAEIFGENLYPTDLLQRKIGFARLAENELPQLNPQMKEILQHYCDGVNAWIESKTILPPEFVLLRFRPRPWRPVDCVSIGIYQTWFAHSLMDHDQQYHKLAEKLGNQIIPLFHEYKSWSPPTVHDSFLKELFAHNPFPLRMSLASNSWVVAPKKSGSGRAIHASDPHLMINMVPCFWYIVGLHSAEGLSVVGVTTPGLPFVTMGHNGVIGFAFTVAGVDLIDYYRAPRHPEDSLKILTARGYQPMTIVSEAIKIQGESNPRMAPLYLTPDGPVVEMDSASVLILKWAGYDFNSEQIFQSILNLQSAKNFEEFRTAVTGLGALDVNWTYSDSSGNIGYQLGAPIPVREYENSFCQIPAESSFAKWNGFVPLEKTPHLLNPTEGWVASCNNQPVSSKWPFSIPGFYDPYRITRVQHWLTQREKYSVADFEQMQLDRISAIALRWKELMASGALHLEKPELAQKIREWNGEMGTDQTIPALFSFWWYYLTRALFEDELGTEWRLGESLREEILTNDFQKIIDIVTTRDKKERPVEIAAKALSMALEQVGERNYGEVCQLTMSHPLSIIKILDYWLDLNRGPFPFGGDNGSLNANWRSYDSEQNQFNSLVGPSMRFILDWADVDQFTINTNLGQSGNPFSSHYADFLEMWRQGERWLVPFHRKAVEARQVSLLTLVPEL